MTDVIIAPGVLNDSDDIDILGVNRPDEKPPNWLQRQITAARQGVNALTQGIDRWTGPAEKEENDRAEAERTKVIGKRKITFVSRPRPTMMSRIIDDLDRQTAGTATGSAPRRDIVPLTSRGTSPHPDHLNGANRPYIQIVLSNAQDRNLAQETLQTYDRFILTTVNETSAEKIDVVETFGMPHVFTSGQFVKRLAIGGIVRSTPRNFSSTDTNLNTPDSVVFKFFYNNYLRATELARRGAIARLYVDGDIYEGYFGNLIYDRVADNEQGIQFSMQMFVLSQRHVEDSKAKSNLSRFDSLKVIQKRFPDDVASAHLAQAIGKIFLAVGTSEPSWSPASGFASGRTTSVDLGEVKSASDPTSTLIRETPTLYLRGVPQQLSVSGGIPGISLTSNRESLDGMIARCSGDATTSMPLTFSVTDYSALYNTVTSDFGGGSDQEGNTTGVASPVKSGTFSIRASDGTEVSIYVSCTVSQRPEATLKEIKLTIGSVTVTVPAGQNPADIPSVFNVTDSSTTPVTVVLSFASNGATVDCSGATCTATASAGASTVSGTSEVIEQGYPPAPVQLTVRGTSTGIELSGSLALGSIGTPSDSPFQKADGWRLKLDVTNFDLRDHASTPATVSLEQFIKHPASSAGAQSFTQAVLRAPATGYEGPSEEPAAADGIPRRGWLVRGSIGFVTPNRGADDATLLELGEAIKGTKLTFVTDWYTDFTDAIVLNVGSRTIRHGTASIRYEFKAPRVVNLTYFEATREVIYPFEFWLLGSSEGETTLGVFGTGRRIGAANSKPSITLATATLPSGKSLPVAAKNGISGGL